MKPFIIHPSPASHHDAQTLEKRRLKAGKLFEKGIHQAEIARRLKVSRQAVHYWYAVWKKKGTGGLRCHRPGPKPRLTAKKLAKVARALAQGPIAAGYDTNLWTLARIAAVIQKKTRISYGTSQVWYLLQALGWSNQKPETRYRDRNETAIKRWKEESWPRIQKRGQKHALA
jgi:transposase